MRFFTDNLIMDIAEFWNRTNNLIKTKKTTQRAVSKACGFIERRIETLVSTGRLPDAHEVFLIAQALNTSVEYLVTGTEPDNTRLLDELQAFIDDRR